MDVAEVDSCGLLSPQFQGPPAMLPTAKSKEDLQRATWRADGVRWMVRLYMSRQPWPLAAPCALARSQMVGARIAKKCSRNQTQLIEFPYPYSMTGSGALAKSAAVTGIVITVMSELLQRVHDSSIEGRAC
jgi:hypothetical protein